MKSPAFRCLPTMVGSLPHRDAADACALVAEFLPDVPAWPQLPARSPLEKMVAQCVGTIPPHVQPDVPLPERELDAYGVDAEHAAGLHAFLAADWPSALVLKGQIVGPITFLQATAQTGRSSASGEFMADYLALKAAWMERALLQKGPITLIVFDEPCLHHEAFAKAPLTESQALSLLERALQGLTALKGIHCCGDADWAAISSLPIDVLSFDLYSYRESILAHGQELGAFVERGGCLALGIVPTDEMSLAQVNWEILVASVDFFFDRLSRYGITRERLAEQSLVTPACGLAGLSVASARRALALTADVSLAARQRYFGLN